MPSSFWVRDQAIKNGSLAFVAFTQKPRMKESSIRFNLHFFNKLIHRDLLDYPIERDNYLEGNR